MRKFAAFFFGWLFSMSIASAQSHTITGKVTDQNGQPLQGVTVVEKNSKKGTVTSANGLFSLSVNTGSTLVFSSVGYSSKEFPVGTLNEVNVTLGTTSQELTEVVVTSFGIKREKKALGYAVSTVNKEQLEQRSEGDLARVLEGKVPGLNIINSSGLSGSGTNIVIRAISTVT
ncbi:MAG: carboxypeptidase-like regulatory domain-containing protein, partial [Parafilimonas sp.]